jgi:hypothetical protein
MSKRYYKPEPPLRAFSDGVSALPINDPIGVYYRQSTDGQVGNISTSIQTIDMPSYLRSRGWSDEQIYLIDMDAGVSGTTKIDERPGMKHLFELITEGKIRAVACQDEDRLFRDITQIQVNIFIEACRKANVLVITPNIVYDFASELTGSFHARQFRFKCEMAADYIDTVIIGKLARAKRRLLMEGRWAGSAVVPGFMIDTRKTLPNGNKNPEWRRFAPFPEYAAVVNEYFRLFLSYAGNVHAAVKHIHAYGPYYPDPHTTYPPEGFRHLSHMKQFANGYCPGRNGLINLLTNAVLIGHWSVNGVIVRWNNHPAIVPEEIFWKAFNYLSAIDLEGNANTNFRPFSTQSRPSLEKDRPVERPLCAGMIVGECSGTWKRVGTVWIKDRQEYIYMHSAKYPAEIIYWRRLAYYLDEAIVKMLHKKMEATFAPDIWETTVARALDDYTAELRRIESQIATLDRVMENYLVSLATLTTPDMIRAVETRYADAQHEHKRLAEGLAKATSRVTQIEALEKLKDMSDPSLQMWDNLTYAEKRTVLHTFIKIIQATEVDGCGLQLTVVWVDESTDAVVLPKMMKHGWRTWLASEIDRLLALIDSGASQVAIAQTFPERTWRQIMDKIADLQGSGSVYFSPKPMHEAETYAMYMERTGGSETPYVASSQELWTPEHTERLLSLLDNGATVRELLEAFPFRRWDGIARKARKLRGKDVRLPRDPMVRSKDTLAIYQERIDTATQQNGVISASLSKSDTDAYPNHLEMSGVQAEDLEIISETMSPARLNPSGGRRIADSW